MKTKQILFILLFASPSLYGQDIEFKIDNKTYNYKELNNPDIKNGLLVLFGYDGGNGNTDIPSVFEKDSVFVIVVNTSSWFIPQADIEMVDACILHALNKYRIPSKKLLIGGFSGGATAAMRYTEQVIERQYTQLIPIGLFVGDAPLDHIEFYKYCEKELVRNCDAPNSIWGKRESEYIKNEYDSLLGDPMNNRDKYIKVSPVTISEPDFGNAKYLLQIPVRSYHEADLMWYVKERCRSILDENIIVGSELINYLYNNGNKQAEIIITLDKGYRNDGMRHPHSWSIIDSKDLLRWYKSL